jgi:hypothetical protein
MKSLIKFIFGILILVSFVGFGSAEYNETDLPVPDGDGWYNISTCSQLQNMNFNLSVNYKLVSNIDCSDTVTWNGGLGFEPVGICGPEGYECSIGNFTYTFQGNFTGNNFTISNLFINRSSSSYVGLFGYASGEIKDVGLVNISISGSSSVGGLAGNSLGLITNSYSTGNVFGFSNVGGLAGNSLGLITNSYSTGNVSGSSNGVGGLVGSSSPGSTISNSYSTGNVFGFSNVGGLAGNSLGLITNSYSTGNVFGFSNVGGLAGYLYGLITNSYSTGNVSGSSNGVGGLVGTIVESSITNSYYDINTSNQSVGAGGVDASQEGVVGKTTAEMMNISTFDGWNFENVWIIDDGFDYPKLRALYHPPTILSLNNGNLDSWDPEVLVEFNTSVIYSRGNLTSALLEWQNSSQEWDEENSVEMNITPINSTHAYVNASFYLPDYDTNITYRIFLTNSLGESMHYYYNIISEYDCSFIISDSFGNFSDGDLGTTGGIGAELSLGNVVINNTGDSNFNNSAGCVIGFGNDSLGGVWSTNNSLNLSLHFSKNYSHFIDPSFFPGGSRGLRYYNLTDNNNSAINSVVLGPKESIVINVKGIFPQIDYVLNEFPSFPIVANVTDSTDNETNKTIHAKMVVTPGAYLEMEIENPTVNPYVINMTINNHNFSAYVRNVVSGTDNNVAYNVTFNWTLNITDTQIEERIENENLNFGPENLNDTNETGKKRINFTLNLTEDNLANITKGLKVISMSALGKNSTGGDLFQGLISENLSIMFECYNQSDGVCVNSCRTYNAISGIYEGILDSDCDYCYPYADGIQIPSCGSKDGDYVASGSGGGGGGGGGAGGGSFSKSEANFELVRGENVEFDLIIENKLSNPKKDVSITVKGNNSEYVIPSPSTLSYLGANSNETIKFKINAPSYFSSGKYLLEITFTGTIEGNTSTKFTEVKYVTLTILELPRSQADSYLNLSLEILSKMNSSGFITDEVQSILDSMNSNYESLNFNLLKEEVAKIEEIYNSANEYIKLREELNQSMAESEKNGISTAETQKLFLLAEILFNRGDYIAAYEKMKEAKTSYLLETKGEFKVLYAIKNNPIESLGILISLGLISVGSGLLIKLRLFKRKLKILAEEEALLLELMKVVQRDCFEYAKMSMEEYGEAMYQYENRLGNVIQEKVRTESEIANLMRLQGKQNSLYQEKARLLILVKQTQEDYLNRGKLDTRVYENMLKTYSSRLSKVEEELVFIEAQEQIKQVSGFWKKMFRRK